MECDRMYILIVALEIIHIAKIFIKSIHVLSKAKDSLLVLRAHCFISVYFIGYLASLCFCRVHVITLDEKRDCIIAQAVAQP